LRVKVESHFVALPGFFMVEKPMGVEELARAFLSRAKGNLLPSAVEDGCALIETLKSPLAAVEAMAVLGAVAAGADFSRCAEKAARYIAVALANTPNAAFAIEGALRELVAGLESAGLHREALLVAASAAKSGDLRLLELVGPRGWAESVLYVEVLADFAKGALNDELHFGLAELAAGAVEEACATGFAPCRYAKASLYSRLASSMAFEGHLDLAEAYMEGAMEAYEELYGRFGAGELREYIDLLFPLGWSEANAKAVLDYLTLLVYSNAVSVYRYTSSEKAYAYVEEFYRRSRGTQFELLARVNWARFAYAFRRISLQQLAEEVEKVHAELAARAFVGAGPAFASYLVKLYLLALAALGRGGEAAELYKAYSGAIAPPDRYAVESYLALLGLIGGVDGGVKRAAALAVVPEGAECVLSGACPPDAALAKRNDTAAALALELAARGEWEEALRVAQRYTPSPDQKETELWDAVAVAVEARDREALKRAALDLLIYLA